MLPVYWISSEDLINGSVPTQLNKARTGCVRARFSTNTIPANRIDPLAGEFREVTASPRSSNV
jgi:hypothetical protein